MKYIVRHIEKGIVINTESEDQYIGFVRDIARQDGENPDEIHDFDPPEHDRKFAIDNEENADLYLDLFTSTMFRDIR